MNREVYQHMNEQLHPTASRVEAAVRLAHRKPRLLLKKIGVSLIAAAVLCGGVTLGASANEDFREALYAISPQIAETFSPIMKSCEYDGIRMTVEAAYYENDKAEIIVAFEDTTGQGRAERIDLCDSYSLRRGWVPYLGEIASYGISGSYDPETGINRKRITLNEPGTIDKNGEILTFSVKMIDYGMEEQRNAVMPVDLSAVSCDPPMRSVEETLVYNDIYSGCGSNYRLPDDFDVRTLRYLAPGEPIELAEGIEITAVGWTDGYLHIQTKIEGNPDVNNVGFWLESDEKRERFDVTWSPEKGVIASETFISMRPEELHETRLMGYIISGGTEVEGDWRVRFPLEKKTDVGEFDAK